MKVALGNFQFKKEKMKNSAKNFISFFVAFFLARQQFTLATSVSKAEEF